MITEEEFLKALEVVQGYKIQVTQQHEEMRKGLDKNGFSPWLITKETLISDADISVRAINSLKQTLSMLDNTRGLKWTYDECEVTLGHFESLTKSQLKSCRNVGEKTMKELEEMFFEAGIILDN